MACYEIHLRERFLEQLRRFLGNELVAGSMEAVFANTHLLVILLVDRIHSRAIGHRLMEGRIEYRYIADALEDLLASFDAAEVRRHVQRTELDELLELGHYLGIYLDRIFENFRAMKNSMADGVDILRVPEIRNDLLKGFGVIGRATRADSLDEAFGESLLALHIEELILERART